MGNDTCTWGFLALSDFGRRLTLVFDHIFAMEFWVWGAISEIIPWIYRPLALGMKNFNCKGPLTLVVLYVRYLFSFSFSSKLT